MSTITENITRFSCFRRGMLYYSAMKDLKKFIFYSERWVNQTRKTLNAGNGDLKKFQLKIVSKSDQNLLSKIDNHLPKDQTLLTFLINRTKKCFQTAFSLSGPQSQGKPFTQIQDKINKLVYQGEHCEYQTIQNSADFERTFGAF